MSVVDNRQKIQRNLINKTSASKHLLCIICQDLFDDPVRISCGYILISFYLI
jgi:hypothetical protein